MSTFSSHILSPGSITYALNAWLEANANGRPNVRGLWRIYAKLVWTTEKKLRIKLEA